MTEPPKTMVRVISLEEAVQRRSSFAAQAKASSTTLDWSFFPARRTIDPDLEYVERRALVARGRQLHPREIACYSSHYAVWKAFLAGEDDQLLVIEDDVALDWLFLERLLRTDFATAGIHYLKLFSKNATPSRAVSNDFLGRWLIDCRGFAYGAQAYLLTRSGAQKFLLHCRKLSRPIDDEMDRSWAHGIPNLSVFPFPAFEHSSPSYIGDGRDDFRPLPSDLRVANVMGRVRERTLRISQRLTGYGLCRKLGAFPSRSWTERRETRPA